MKKNLLIGILPLVFGGFIYLVYRSENLNVFTWFNQAGLSQLLDILRSNRFLMETKPPIWIKFSLPDALWLFSFNYILLTFWKFSINRNSALWLLTSTLIGLFSEIGQLFGVVPGTFDPIDLGMLIVAALLPFIFVKNLNLKIN